MRASLGDEIERFAVVVKNLADGSGVVLDPGREFYAASLYKTWVMLEAFRHREAALLSFDARYTVTPHYEAFGLNPGELAACDEVAAGEALRRALALSKSSMTGDWSVASTCAPRRAAGILRAPLPAATSRNRMPARSSARRRPSFPNQMCVGVVVLS